MTPQLMAGKHGRAAKFMKLSIRESLTNIESDHKLPNTQESAGVGNFSSRGEADLGKYAKFPSPPLRRRAIRAANASRAVAAR